MSIFNLIEVPVLTLLKIVAKVLKNSDKVVGKCLLHLIFTWIKVMPNILKPKEILINNKAVGIFFIHQLELIFQVMKLDLDKPLVLRKALSKIFKCHLVLKVISIILVAIKLLCRLKLKLHKR